MSLSIGLGQKLSLKFVLFVTLTLASPGFLWANERPCEKLLSNKTPFIRPNAGVDEKGQIKLSLTDRDSLTGKLTNILARAALNPLFNVKKLQGAITHLHNALKDPAQTDKPYFQKVAEAFQVTGKFNEAFLADVPKTGPLIVTMNHPLSGPELIAVAAAIQRVRPDVKVISSTFLEAVPGFPEHAILVNNMGGEAARAYNLVQRQRIVESLQRGEAIVISPAGAVSVKEKLSDKVVNDPPWKLGVADFISKVPGTSVLPVYVDGGPTQAFHIAKRIHDFAGTAMILREISEVIGKDIHFALSKPVGPEEIANFGNDRRELTKYLRARTYMLAESMQAGGSKAQQSRKRSEPIAEAIDPAVLEAELAKTRVIFDMAPDNPDKAMKTYMAFGADIPNVMQEIGRLREMTFWQANEGTGRARDLDEFDPHYVHLIAYDKKLKRIAGAYRIGLTDQLVSKYGLEGTYIAHYFDVGPHLNNRLARLVEIGRSFVLPEYQGRSFAFPALFQGIGRFLAYHPQYEGFFGAVSVSNEYRETSKLLILKWAEMHAGAAEFGQITSKNPPKFTSRLTAEDVEVLLRHSKDIKDLNELVASVEGDPKARAPQLIPIYQDVGAKFLAFDKDSDFNTIDGLIFTSILSITHEQRLRYMGEDGTKNFESYWKID